MRHTQEQLTTWISRLDSMRQHLSDELLWLKIEELIRLSLEESEQGSEKEGGPEMAKVMVNQAVRRLSIYDRLLNGQVINKKETAFEYGVDARTIQRDFDDIQAYLSEVNDRKRELVYDRAERGFVMKGVFCRE